MPFFHTILCASNTRLSNSLREFGIRLIRRFVSVKLANFAKRDFAKGYDPSTKISPWRRKLRIWRCENFDRHFEKSIRRSSHFVGISLSKSDKRE